MDNILSRCQTCGSLDLELIREWNKSSCDVVVVVRCRSCWARGPCPTASHSNGTQVIDDYKDVYDLASMKNLEEYEKIKKR